MSKKVAQYDPATGERLAVYPSLAVAAASVYKGDPGNISRACRGKQETSYGYRWQFVRLNVFTGAFEPWRPPEGVGRRRRNEAAAGDSPPRAEE